MLTISLWAKRHPRLSQFLIAIFICVQILLAFEAGIRLSILEVYLGDWAKVLAIVTIGALILLFPSGERLKKKSWFTQRRYLWIGGQLFIWSGFLLAVFTTNRIATPAYFLQETGRPTALKVAIQEQPQSSKHGIIGKGKTTIKSWKKAFRELVKERKAQLRPNKNRRFQGSGGGSGWKIFLFSVLSALLACVIASGACALICSGGGYIILGLIVAGGGAWLIFLINCAGTRWAFGRTRKDSASRMSIGGWILIALGLIFGFLVLADGGI